MTKILKGWHLSKLPTKKARKLERQLHNFLAKNCTKKENHLTTREEAAKIVAEVTEQVGPYKCVSHANCYKLLGEKFDLLLKDPIRNKGPQGYIYYWNVIDYLVLK